ncbi:MAG: serine hydrolase domain-containing protein [Burkholderiales bacterium]
MTTNEAPTSASRRRVLCVIGAASLAPLAARAQPADVNGIPVTGRALPGMEPLDESVTSIMRAHAIPGASIAIARDGKLKLARGYGYADLAQRQPMRPETRVALASVSKVLTGQTILKLVGEGKLRLSDRAFGFFPDMRPPEGMREDPRLAEITIQMLLHHTGGWDRKAEGDPSGWGPRIDRALRLNQPPTPFEMIRYMKGVPLDFAPGTRQVYSNFGFVLLGGVIAKVTGQAYADYVQQNTLRAMGATSVKLDDVSPRYLPGEAKRYVLGGEREVPGGNSRMMMASGGWQATSVDMMRIMTAIDGSRTGTPFLPPAMIEAMLEPAPGIAGPSPDHWMGLAWDMVQAFPGPGGKRYSYGKDGGLPGVQTYVEHLAIGANYALLINSAPPEGGGQPGGLKLIQPKLVEFIRQAPVPEGDLFGAFA